MSILPLPEIPQPDAEGVSQPEPAPQPPPVFHFSALDSYAGQPGALPGVPFWPRAAARVIDFIVHYLIVTCSGFFTGILIAIAAAIQHNPAALRGLRGSSNSISLFMAALLGSIFLEAVCEGFHGSTPGKLISGLVVVQEDGSPCRPGAAFIRSFAYLIDGLFFGLIGYFNMQKNPQFQRYGDEWAETIVCRRSAVQPQNLRGAGIFTMVFLLAAMVDAAFVICGLVIKFF